MLGAAPHPHWRRDREDTPSKSFSYHTCLCAADGRRHTFASLCVGARSTRRVRYIPPFRMPSKTPHPLTGQCLHVHGAPVGGYEIPSNGIIHPHDTNGKKLQVFNVGRKVTLLEAAAKLELHIQKCLQQQGEWFLHSNAVLCAELSLLRPCCVLFSCAEATEPHDRSHLPQVHPVALAIRLKL